MIFSRPAARRIPLIVLALIPLIAAAASPVVVHENALRKREIAIARQLRCTVCQGESVAESNAGIARDMRRLIRKKLAAGESKREIIAYFVHRYGDFILLKPRFDAIGSVLWVAPVVLTVVLSAIAYGFLRRRPPGNRPAPPVLSPEDEARVQAARREER
ncbi:MAG: cytochrome c-type biogenesis protein [Acidiferrobacteraceae bacterium]